MWFIKFHKEKSTAQHLLYHSDDIFIYVSVIVTEKNLMSTYVNDRDWFTVLNRRIPVSLTFCRKGFWLGLIGVSWSNNKVDFSVSLVKGELKSLGGLRSRGLDSGAVFEMLYLTGCRIHLFCQILHVIQSLDCKNVNFNKQSIAVYLSTCIYIYEY